MSEIESKVFDTERERERERESKKERKRDRENIYEREPKDSIIIIIT